MKARVAISLILATVGSCQVRDTTDLSQPRHPVAAVADSALVSFAWLAGYWTGNEGGTRMEELWLPPRGHVMLGVHMDLFASGRSFYEYLRIEQRGDTVLFAASPRGRAPTFFMATEIGDERVTFENPEHDYPQKISYHTDPGGRLHAAIAGEEDGSEKSSAWIWERTPLPGQP